MRRFGVAVAILLLGALVNTIYSMPDRRPSRRLLREFPIILGEWEMVSDQEMDEKSLAVLRVDDYLLRTYRDTDGKSVHLYIGYFAMQREGKQIHSPRQCLPGSGWKVIKRKEEQLPASGGIPGESKANFFLMGKQEDRQLYIWWYHGRGRAYANEYSSKLYRLWDAMTMRRTDEALVRVSLPVKADVDEARETALAFVDRLAGAIPDFLPD